MKKINFLTMLVGTTTLIAIPTSTLVSFTHDHKIQKFNKDYKNITKLDLNTVTLNSHITIRNAFTEDPRFRDLDIEYLTNNSYFKQKKLSAGYDLRFYNDLERRTMPDMSNQLRWGDTIFVTLTAAASDSYWTGTTRLFKVSIAKNIGRIKLPSTTLKVKDGQRFSEINTSPLINIPTFEFDKIAPGYSVKYYLDKNGENEIDQTALVQNNRKFFISLTAANYDRRWAGTTQISEINLEF